MQPGINLTVPLLRILYLSKDPCRETTAVTIRNPRKVWPSGFTSDLDFTAEGCREFGHYTSSGQQRCSAHFNDLNPEPKTVNLKTLSPKPSTPKP